MKRMEREEKTDKSTGKFRSFLFGLVKEKLSPFIIIGIFASLIYVFAFSYAGSRIAAQMIYEATLKVKEEMLKDMVENTIVFLDNSYEDYKKRYPDADEDEIEDEMYRLLYRKIYSEKHSDGVYMWVNKVLDYNGGDNYAIRLIHPNLKDTEGDYLTTNEVNPMGIKAYEEELNGVKEKGAVFLTYDFKKIDSDEVTQKVTYSCLYRKYDWIICMGVNLDNLDHYKVQANNKLRYGRRIVLVCISLTWMVLLSIMFKIYREAEIGKYIKKNKELNEKLERDVLTGAGSRDYGTELLKREYNEFRRGKANTLILMMDVDNFKIYNDEYGHDVGDMVLNGFVNKVRSGIAAEDVIIRWGGDEFIVILQDVAPQELESIADRILVSVRSVDIRRPDLPMVTTSMGFSYFADSDTEYLDVINRADKALYKAKEAGRNNWKKADM
ncbi:MAG: diguanylate cyclase [Lachnospiraceae bacterium]|nr:diguanylate cyclase [Lachnospiraceae bacterium]